MCPPSPPLLSPTQLQSALLLEAFHLLALGSYHESLNISSQVEWEITPPSSKEAGSLEAAFVERVRGKVVEGELDLYFLSFASYQFSSSSYG